MNYKSILKEQEESYFTINEDNTLYVVLPVEFAEIASMEKLVKEQVKDATISSSPSINQLVVNLKEKSQLSYLEELLGNSDKLPPQVLLRFSASSDFGDKAQDYASAIEYEPSYYRWRLWRSNCGFYFARSFRES